VLRILRDNFQRKAERRIKGGYYDHCFLHDVGIRLYHNNCLIGVYFPVLNVVQRRQLYLVNATDNSKMSRDRQQTIRDNHVF